jgi:hypothetical protein
MALSILDGNQSATTLSTIVTSGQHIPAHTVVSLGTQAITDMRSAVSGSVVSISNFPASQVISGTVTANPTGTQTITGSVTANVPVLDQQIRDGILLFNQTEGNIGVAVNYAEPITGSVTIGAGTAQIGSVTAFVSDLANVTEAVDEAINQSVIAIHIKDLAGNVLGTSVSPMLISGTVTIGSLPAISGTVTANTFALQGTAVTTSNFTSTTASTVLANYNATREVLTIFNEGAGNLHICAGATCTTIAYQVRLSAGDYYEVPNHQTTITHSAVFATAGTARVTQVS